MMMTFAHYSSFHAEPCARIPGAEEVGPLRRTCVLGSACSWLVAMETTLFSLILASSRKILFCAASESKPKMNWSLRDVDKAPNLQVMASLRKSARKLIRARALGAGLKWERRTLIIASNDSLDF
jgi:hypothetical protein